MTMSIQYTVYVTQYTASYTMHFMQLTGLEQGTNK